MSEVTQILNAIERGENQAAADLLPLVYDELRKLATQKLAQEKSGQTLQPTALVHEAYLRLVGPANADGFANRRHFFGAAAEAMRRILVNHARDKGRQKRGGGRVRLELLDQASAVTQDLDLVLSLDDLLRSLEAEDTLAAQITQLHLFGGLSVDEAGETLGLSRSTAYCNWKYARAWLREALK